MSYAKKRAEGKAPSEVYAEIRKKRTEEVLESGERWMVTIRGVPWSQVTTKKGQELAKWITENTTKEERERIKFHNLLSGIDVSVKEMKESRL